MQTSEVREVAEKWVSERMPGARLGLPEYDDRLRVWRVSIVASQNGTEPIGEVRVAGGKIVFSSNTAMMASRLGSQCRESCAAPRQSPITIRSIPSGIVLGDAREVLAEYPPESAQLVFTSPPYYNAKPECHESHGYEEYLELIRSVFEECYYILNEGRFLVVNTSPVLIRRPHRNASSRRIPITYDIHAVLSSLGFEFIDEIIWQKPEGAGWNIGRGRRFAADRQPLQYKPVTVTENIVVYRKKTERLIDWNLRNHPDQDAVADSLIEDGYERTNIWRIHPASHKKHPAVFPEALAERVIRYYSFKGDLVLDPFAGTGTTGRVAGRLERRFLLVEKSEKYYNIQKADEELMSYKPQVKDYEFYAGTLL